MKDSMRPPTLKMIEKLKECYQNELNNNHTPFLAEEMKSSLPGLYRRGLIETKMEWIDRKNLLCVYVTEKGKKFLEDFSSLNE